MEDLENQILENLIDDYISDPEDPDTVTLPDLAKAEAQTGSALVTQQKDEETKSKPVTEAKPSVGGADDKDEEEVKVSKIKKGKVVEQPEVKATAKPVVKPQRDDDEEEGMTITKLKKKQ